MNKYQVAIMALAFTFSGCGNTHYEYFQGSQGPRGATGSAGAPGTDGASCSVQAVDPGGTLPNGGALITCGSTQTILSNGSDGAPGAAAPVNEILDPCGPQTAHDEVLIRGGSVVIASFSENPSGKNTRFSVLVPGVTYTTTDGTNCSFSVNADGTLNH